MTEQRRLPRVQVEQQAYIGTNGDRMKTYLRDVSLASVGLLSSLRFDDGSYMMVSFTPDEECSNDPKIEIYCQVVHCSYHPELHSYHIGLMITDSSPEHALLYRKYVKSKMNTNKKPWWKTLLGL